MNLLITNGGERGDHHIEAIKPAPVLNVVKAHRPRGGEQQQGDNDDLKQAKALQVQAELLKFFKSRARETGEGSLWSLIILRIQIASELISMPNKFSANRDPSLRSGL